MILRIKHYKERLKDYDIFIPEFNQTVSEDKLIKLIPDFDAWIVGDDPATRKVLKAGVKKKLKCVIKWGIGTDNIDKEAIKELGIKFSNTPNMFGSEVADVAIGYLISLTRKLYIINQNVKNGRWYKPTGISIKDQKVCLIGFGDIGRSVAQRLIVMGANLYVSDPGFSRKDDKIICNYNTEIEIPPELNNISLNSINVCATNALIVIITCPLVESTYHLINNDLINLLQDKCYIVNVSRGPIVDEKVVVTNLETGKIAGFAADVFEKEPVIPYNPLCRFNNVIVGSHNASNTYQAVDRSSYKAIELVKKFLSS